MRMSEQLGMSRKKRGLTAIEYANQQFVICGTTLVTISALDRPWPFRDVRKLEETVAAEAAALRTLKKAIYAANTASLLSMTGAAFNPFDQPAHAAEK